MSTVRGVFAAVILLFGSPLLAGDHRFYGSMPEAVLRNYLWRSMTTMYLLSGQGTSSVRPQRLAALRVEVGPRYRPRRLRADSGNAVPLRRVGWEALPT